MAQPNLALAWTNETFVWPKALSGNSNLAKLRAKKEKRPEAVLIRRGFGRGERIRTSGLLVPNQALYQAEPRPDGWLID